MKHNGPISCLARAGRYVITGGYDGAVALYEPRRGVYLSAHHEHDDLVTCVSATDRSVFSGGADGRVVVARRLAHALLTTGRLELDDDVESLLAIDDENVLAGLGNGSVYQLAFRNGCATIASRLLRINGTITSLRSFGTGKMALTCNDGTLRLFDLATPNECSVLYQSPLPLKNCLVLPEHGLIITGGHDGKLVAVSPTEPSATVVESFGTSVRGMTASRDLLYVGVYDGTIHRYGLPDVKHDGIATVSATRGEPWTRQLVTADTDIAYVAAFSGVPLPIDSPNQAHLASNINVLSRLEGERGLVAGTDTGEIMRCRPGQEALSVQQLHCVAECITGIAEVGPGRVATCTWSGGVFMDGTELYRASEPLLGLAFTGSELAVGTYGGEVRRLTSTGAVTGTVRALSSSVKMIATHSQRAYVVGRYSPMAILDTASWRVCARVPLETRVSDAVAVSASGNLLAVAAKNNEVWVFLTRDLVSPDPTAVRIVKVHKKPPKDVAWAGDGVLFTVGYDGLVARHDMDDNSSQTRNLHAACEAGLCGVAAIDERTVMVAGFNGSLHRVTFD